MLLSHEAAGLSSATKAGTSNLQQQGFILLPPDTEMLEIREKIVKRAAFSGKLPKGLTPLNPGVGEGAKIIAAARVVLAVG